MEDWESLWSGRIIGGEIIEESEEDYFELHTISMNLRRGQSSKSGFDVIISIEVSKALLNIKGGKGLKEKYHQV